MDTVILNGPYYKHIYIILVLFRLDEKYNIYSSPELFNKIFNIDTTQYYSQVATSLFNAINSPLTHVFLMNVEKNIKIDSYEQSDKINDQIIQLDGETLEQAQQNVLKFISSNINIPDLDKFKDASIDIKQNIISQTISYILDRIPSNDEIQYHINNNNYNSCLFTWILVLCLCSEGKHKNRDILFKQAAHAFRGNPPDKYKNKRIALMFCGHTRNLLDYVYKHQWFMNYNNIDVFIHTWDDPGLKAKSGNIWLEETSSKIDVELIKKYYNPKIMKINNNKELFDKMSLVNKISPIFLYISQAKDDATKYINSQLFSIYSCFKLIEYYENMHQFKYDAVIKMRFDFAPTHVDYNEIFENMEENTLWFPHALYNNHPHHGGGGGCTCCDHNTCTEQHHANDLCDIWYYGKRDLMQKACELFVHAENILKINTPANINMLNTNFIKHKKEGDFIYIYNSRDIENSVVCYYPERLLREHLRGIVCKSSSAIRGSLG